MVRKQWLMDVIDEVESYIIRPVRVTVYVGNPSWYRLLP
jgi:hypothetical protein